MKALEQHSLLWYDAVTMSGSKSTSATSDITHKSDEEILSLAIHTPHLFEILVDRYQDAFLRKAESVIRGREDAEDIVQETFTKIYLHASKFQVQEGASFKSWGYKILMNTSFTHYKKRKRRLGATAQLNPEFYEMLPDRVSRDSEKHELSDYLISVFSRMPENLARSLQLHFVEGRPQAEVGAIEGVSVGAIKTRIHRAKKEFKKISKTFL